MNTSLRWCVTCGAEYVAGVVRCVDCDVPLVDVRPVTVEDIVAPDEEAIVYDLDDVEADERFEIHRLLDAAGIKHAWEGASLVIAPEDEQRTDELLEVADEEAFLDADIDQLSYDLEDWDDDRRGRLVEVLAEAGIEHAWDENGQLVVAEENEERVDTILDAIEFPDQLPADEDAGAGDGLEAQEVLSELFLAADRLMHDPSDHESVLRLVDASRMAEPMVLPFGFAPALWSDIVGQAVRLRDKLEGVVEDEVIQADAETLRNTLRPLV